MHILQLYALDKKGKTALMWAAKSNPTSEVTSALLQVGADVHAQNEDAKQYFIMHKKE